MTRTELKQAVRTLIESHGGASKGLVPAAKQLQVSKEALTRVLADMDVRAGTAALIEQNLSKAKAEKKASKKTTAAA